MRRVLDATALVLFAALVVLTPVWEQQVRFGPLEITLAAASLVALALRRKWTYVAVAVITLALVSGYTLHTGIAPYQVSLGLALYSLGAQRARWEAWLTAGAVGAALTAAVAPSGAGDLLSLLLWLIVTVTAGDLTRNRRAYLAAVEDRAERAELDRENEARRRVAEERLQIARDVHDTLGHRIAVMNIQSFVAAQLIASDPAGARKALDHVRHASSTIIKELSELLDVLRTTESTTQIADFDALPELIAGLTAVGFVVETSVDGRPEPLSPAVGQAAYRIVQESLTNAVKYGAGQAATLRLAYLAASLHIEVQNDLRDGELGRPLPESSGGNGIPGMRERAHYVGGKLAAIRTNHRFKVVATLPYARDVT